VATLGLLARSVVAWPPKPALSAANPPVVASESPASPAAAAAFAKDFVQQSLKGKRRRSSISSISDVPVERTTVLATKPRSSWRVRVQARVAGKWTTCKSRRSLPAA